jgi:hypothetical protein
MVAIIIRSISVHLYRFSNLDLQLTRRCIDEHGCIPVWIKDDVIAAHNNFSNGRSLACLRGLSTLQY